MSSTTTPVESSTNSSPSTLGGVSSSSIGITKIITARMTGVNRIPMMKPLVATVATNSRHAIQKTRFTTEPPWPLRPAPRR